MSPRPSTFSRTRRVPLAAALALALTGTVAGSAALHAGGPQEGHPQDDALVTTVSQVDRATEWKLEDTQQLDFDTFHPQAMEVTKDRIYLSSVEIIERPQKYPEPRGGYDRSPGRGVGHLFVMDRQGNLIEDIELGEGDMYHPGGLDIHDGRLWLPVAEYRPNSASIVYSVDLKTLEAREEFRAKDHVGGVVYDASRHEVVAQTWGSRRFLTFSEDGRLRDLRLNDSHFIDYQDCEYVPRGKMLCSGVAELPQAPGVAGKYELGGLALVDLREHRIMHEVPVQVFSRAGHVITRNPVDVDVTGTGELTMWGAPDDSDEGAGTEIRQYRAEVGTLR